MTDETDEVDLPGKRDYAKELIYKHSWRGDRDRKINHIKRLGRKKYMKVGLGVGIALGVLMGLGLIVFALSF